MGSLTLANGETPWCLGDKIILNPAPPWGLALLWTALRVFGRHLRYRLAWCWRHKRVRQHRPHTITAAYGSNVVRIDRR